MDLTGVSKKVDSNLEFAREQYRLDEERKAKKEEQKRKDKEKKSP